jgi:hypothetical protein
MKWVTSATIIVLISCPGWARAFPPISLDDPLPFEVTEQYEPHTIDGVTVYVGPELQSKGEETVSNSLKCLEKRLKESFAVFPAQHLVHLRRVKLWIEWDNSAVFKKHGFSTGSSRYIIKGSKDLIGYFGPIRGNKAIEYAKRGGIEVPAVKMLLEPKLTRTMHYSPYWLIHEFAHAYHDHVVGEEGDSRIANAYRAAKERHLYDSVEARRLNANGKVELVSKEATANMDRFEYFAELSMVYFAGNSSFPYTRDDLKKHDPVGFKLMEEIWGRIESK